MAGNQQTEGREWPRTARVLASVLLAGHLAAIFSYPFYFASSQGPSASPLAEAVRNRFAPYIQAAFVDHGYFFFAPNPGASHLVEYTLYYDDGRPPERGVFPDLQRHRPRLLYHRHFMLSEFLNNHFVPPAPPPELREDRQAMAQWRQARQAYESLRGGFEHRLKARSGADRVTLYRVEHRPPSPLEFERGVRLDDPVLFRRLPEELPLDEEGEGTWEGAGR